MPSPAFAGRADSTRPALPPTPNSHAVAHRARPWWILAIGLLFFAGLFFWASWERWLPATPVKVVRVEAVRAAAGAAAPASPKAEASVAFQAAGWIEADPFMHRATALVSGVVKSVAVVEGQRVAAGDELARLDQTDFEFALRQVEAGFAAAEAQVATTAAGLQSAAAREQELAGRIRAEQARLAEVEDRSRRLQAAGRSISQGEGRQAALQLSAAEEALAALRLQEAVLAAERQAAIAEQARAEAALRSAAIEVEARRLDLQRSVITAPIAGIIQRLHAVPGRKQMLGSDAPLSTTVAELFDPENLQVRVDVALADAGGLQIGQATQIVCEIYPQRSFAGRVTRLEGHADLSRNTLQAKVRILQPEAWMRPDMLCRVQFLQTPVSGGETSLGAADGIRLLLPPTPGLELPEQGEAEVWIVDADNRVQRRTIRIEGRLGKDRIITDGLLPGAWVVAGAKADLRPGQRVVAQLQGEELR